MSSLDTSCMALNSLSATAPASALAMMDAIAETCSGEASSKLNPSNSSLEDDGL